MSHILTIRYAVFSAFKNILQNTITLRSSHAWAANSVNIIELNENIARYHHINLFQLMFNSDSYMQYMYYVNKDKVKIQTHYEGLHFESLKSVISIGLHCYAQNSSRVISSIMKVTNC